MTKIVVALDINKNRAVEIIESVSPYTDYFKVGHKLFTEDPQVINLINSKGKKCFLDLKYHDIPSVVKLAIEEVKKRYSPFAVTLHVFGGEKMLKEALSISERPLLFGVTILTSLSSCDLSMLGIKIDIKAQVQKMALFAKNCGLDGIVCSGQEAELVKKTCGDKFLTLVPGLQISQDKKQYDQKRGALLKEVKDFVDYAVFGRNITDLEKPELEIKKILEQLND